MVTTIKAEALTKRYDDHPVVDNLMLDIPAGDGRVIAYNFNPMHRDLNHSDYRFLWNAILNWRYLLDEAAPR